MPGLRRRLPPDQRRAEIVAVARRLIAERGFRGVTVQQVAEAAGMTVAGLLHHVGDKDGILLAVLSDRDAVDLESVARQVALPPGTPGRGRALLDAVVERNAGQPEIVRLYTVLDAEALAPEHPAHAYFVERDRQARETFADWLAGEVPDPDAAAVQVLAAMDGLQLQWLRAPEEFDLRAAWRTAADALLGAAAAGA
ncbi:TetR family transcriptional regulator [Motilibacter rhizosphaerae]|uniref:TetR family transcriptional regulator n=1 Tax=Motilibacter rhizosphaerae TaxID=598652 RepID=A0A4Q7NPX7_9ACTN|nr:TetR/AcrR family transcriptional regulator [Motilibacter rhizosphaerae]RZS87384.1 TetR family transcriptional regulator [Motilibacter rhizosphaerae]